ncbi:competence protein ComFC [Candidatus Magnetomoraceae bacterium gMMP-15]
MQVTFNICRICWQNFLQVFFPARCLVCKKYLSLKEQQKTALDNIDNLFIYLMAPYLCINCSKNFEQIKPSLCSVCGNIFGSRQIKNHLCSECITSPKNFYKARAFGIYKDSLKNAISHLKYHKKIQLAKPLSKILQNTFFKFWKKHDVDLVIPVPLHIKRLRQRGFNQSYLLIKNWKNNHELPKVNLKILERRRWTTPQTNLKRKERLTNLNNAFIVLNPNPIKGKTILLIDDVYTTGSTVNECSKVLLKAGAARVDVLTLARTVHQ